MAVTKDGDSVRFTASTNGSGTVRLQKAGDPSWSERFEPDEAIKLSGQLLEVIDDARADGPQFAAGDAVFTPGGAPGVVCGPIHGRRNVFAVKSDATGEVSAFTGSDLSPAS